MPTSKLVNALSNAVKKQLSETHHNQPTARYYFGTFIAAEASDANLSIVRLSTGTLCRYVPKLIHVTGLTPGVEVVLIAPQGLPMHIVGIMSGNNYNASVPWGDSSTPTVPGNPTLTAHTTTTLTLSWVGSSSSNGIAGYDVFVGGVYNQSTIGTTAQLAGLTPATNYSITVMAHDQVGNVSSKSGALSATTDTPPAGGPTQYTKTYTATWSASFNAIGTDEYDSAYGSTCYQGQSVKKGHNLKSMIGFNYSQIQTDLAGSTSVGANIRLTYAHWYYVEGGTAIIGTHNAASQPTKFTGSTDQYQSAGWHAGETRNVVLNPSVVDSFRNGTVKGIVLGPGLTTNVSYFGYAYGAGSSGVYVPLLTLTYVK